MEQTKTLPPLVSEQMRRLSSRMGNAEAYAIIQGFAADVEAIEADRQRTREVVQVLVDLIAELRCKEGCRKYEPGGTAPLCYQCGERHRILALAKSQLQIKPTK